MTFEDIQHQSSDDWDEPSRSCRKRRHMHPRSAESFSEIIETIEIDLESDLPGAIYEVPDKMWGIAAPGRDWHPGICIFSSARDNDALLVKGTSQLLVGDLSRYFLLDPNNENGLRHPTAFNLTEIFNFPRQKVALLHLGRLLGRLSKRELIRLQEDLMYLRCDVGA
jgi:hypothetical protein